MGLLVDYGALDGSAQGLAAASASDSSASQSLSSVTGSGGACDPIAAGAYENMAKLWEAQVAFLTEAASNFGTGTSSASSSYQNGDATGAGAYPR